MWADKLKEEGNFRGLPKNLPLVKGRSDGTVHRWKSAGWQLDRKEVRPLLWRWRGEGEGEGDMKKDSRHRGAT